MRRGVATKISRKAKRRSGPKAKAGDSEALFAGLQGAAGNRAMNALLGESLQRQAEEEELQTQEEPEEELQAQAEPKLVPISPTKRKKGRKVKARAKAKARGKGKKGKGKGKAKRRAKGELPLVALPPDPLLTSKAWSQKVVSPLENAKKAADERKWSDVGEKCTVAIIGLREIADSLEVIAEENPQAAEKLETLKELREEIYDALEIVDKIVRMPKSTGIGAAAGELIIELHEANLKKALEDAIAKAKKYG